MRSGPEDLALLRLGVRRDGTRLVRQRGGIEAYEDRESRHWFDCWVTIPQKNVPRGSIAAVGPRRMRRSRHPKER